MPDSEVLTIERDGHVATLWLDRAEARNAMGPAFWNDLPLAMAELSADSSVRAVVVAARGPHFSVGLDLKAMASMLMAPAGGAAGDGPAGNGATAPSMASAEVNTTPAASALMAQPSDSGTSAARFITLLE